MLRLIDCNDIEKVVSYSLKVKLKKYFCHVKVAKYAT